MSPECEGKANKQQQRQQSPSSAENECIEMVLSSLKKPQLVELPNAYSSSNRIEK